MEHRSLSPDFIVSNDDHVGGNQQPKEPSPNVASAQLLKRGEVECPVNCSDSELCTFLQALEEGFLPTYYSDTSQSAQSRSMSIASKSYLRGKKTVVFHGFQSLQMFRSSTGQGGEDSSIASAEAFPARTSAWQEKEPALTANDPVYGQSLRGSLAKFDPVTHSLRTAQCSLFEDSTESFVTLPRWGLMRDGVLYPQPIAALPISEKGSGSWPTPTVQDSNKATKRWREDHQNNLTAAVFNPHRIGMCQTPCAGNHKGAVKGRYLGSADYRGNLDEWVKDGPNCGHLNPDWVEWLMGWPIGHTDLKPLETDRFQFAPQQLSDYLQPTTSRLFYG